MKKLLVTFSLLLMCTLFVFSIAFKSPDIRKSSDVLDGEWNKTYGIGEILDIKQTRDGGFIMVADSQDHPMDIRLIKTDKQGNEIWNKTYGGKGQDVPTSVIEVEDGYVIGGYTDSFGSGDADFWLIKTDRQGNEIWNKTYGGKFDEWIMKIVQTSDKGYFLLGTKCLDEGCGGSVIWLVKVDENGNEIWNKTYGIYDEWGCDIIKTGNYYIISGVTESYATHGFGDTWLIKIDENGNEIWNKTYGWEDSLQLGAYVEEAEDGYVIGGDTDSSPSAYLIKVDKEGNEIWKRRYGGHGVTVVEDIAKIPDGYLLAGATDTNEVGYFDAWLLKVDKEGYEIWEKKFGGRERDIFNAVLPTEDGYIAGGSIGYYINSLPYGYMWVVKCKDYPPPQITIVRPKKNYLYVFDREIMPYYKTMAIGGLTIIAVADNNEIINRVEFYLTGLSLKEEYDHKPRIILYSPPYEWKFKEIAITTLVRPLEITCVAHYGNAGAVAVDKIEVYIINLLPSSLSQSS